MGGLLGLSLLLAPAMSIAQTYQLGRSVMGSTGHLSTTGTYQVSGTAGEVAITTEEFSAPLPGSGITFLTQGFQQPKDNFVLSLAPGPPIDLVFYPNPVFEDATLEISSDKIEEIHLELYDLRGRKVLLNSKPMYTQPQQVSRQRLVMGHLASGQYVLLLKDNRNDLRSRVLISKEK